MSTSSIVVVGASAGGIPSLERLVGGLPPDFAAPVCVVLHISPHAVSTLPQILSRAGPLPALHPEAGESLQPGRIYVAPPDHHLLVDGMRAGLGRGPRENRFRPSIDALFRSAAYTYGPGAIGVVLSGALDDGTSGLWAIKRLGGTTVVQDPAEAPFDSMPISAMREVEIDQCVPVASMGRLLTSLVAREPASAPHVADELRHRLGLEVAIAGNADAFEGGIMALGPPTAFTCPDCHGVLVDVREDQLRKFRCHTGHSFSSNALLAGLTESIGSSISAVGRALEECVMLLEDSARTFAGQGEAESARRFLAQAKDYRERARAFHVLASKHDILSEDAMRVRAQERNGTRAG